MLSGITSNVRNGKVKTMGPFQVVVLSWLVFVVVGVATHVQLNPPENQKNQRSPREFGCNHEFMVHQKLAYGKFWDEKQEDHLFGHMKRCSHGGNGSKSCLVGPEQVYKAYLENDVGFVFITQDFAQCIEAYRVQNSSQFILLYKNTEGRNSTPIIHKNGDTLVLMEAKPFFPFIASRAKVDKSSVFRVSTCLLDTTVHNYMLEAAGIFGLRKDVIRKGDVIPPRKSMGCTMSQVGHAFDINTETFDETPENMILANVGVCEHHDKDLCVYGFKDVINTYERGKLMVVVVSPTMNIITNEYYNSVTGQVLYRHLHYFDRHVTDDIIIDGTLHYFSRCLPLLDYMQELGVNHTAIVRVTKCVRDFDDFAFNTKYDGIIGLLLSHPRDLGVQNTGTPNATALNQTCSQPSVESNTPTVINISGECSTVWTAIQFAVIALQCLVIAGLVILIMIIKKNTGFEVFPME